MLEIGFAFFKNTIIKKNRNGVCIFIFRVYIMGKQPTERIGKMMNEVEVNDYKRWNITAEEKFESDEEAREFVKLAQKGNERAMESIIRKNVPMISMYAKSYSRRGSNFDDLFSEGMMAIIKTVEKFDVKSTVTVGTALITAVRTAMRRYAGSDRNIRIAINANENKSKLHAIIDRMKAEGKKLTIENIAKEMKIDVKKAKQLFEIDLGVVSMNVQTESKEGEGNELGDFIVSDTKNPYEEVEQKDQFEELKSAIAKLNEVEQIVIEFRYGVNGKEKKTLAEVSAIIGKTIERVRQIEMNALLKMKANVTA